MSRLLQCLLLYSTSHYPMLGPFLDRFVALLYELLLMQSDTPLFLKVLLYKRIAGHCIAALWNNKQKFLRGVNPSVIIFRH